MEDSPYKLIEIVPGTDEWRTFHRIQRTSLFRQAEDEYDPLYHDACFRRPAQRTQLLLTFRDKAVGGLVLDDFGDKTAATRAVVIADEYQSKGHGFALGTLTQAFAKNRGIKQLCVNAGVHATGFYQRLGFVQEVWDLREYDGVVNPEVSIQMVCRNL